MTESTQRNVIILILIAILWVIAGKPGNDDFKRYLFRTYSTGETNRKPESKLSAIVS